MDSFRPELYLGWHIGYDEEMYDEIVYELYMKYNIIDLDIHRVLNVEELRKIVYKNRLNSKFILRGVN